jgi:glutamate synthase (NADPH/NADH) small chain
MEDNMSEKTGKNDQVSRQPMPEQKAEIRKRNFEEVPLGYTEDLAVKEAERCLECKKPSCMNGCPVSVNIPDFIRFIKEREFTHSIRKIWERNALPAVCGRVCPQEAQCEGQCILGKKGEPVERRHGKGDLPPKAKTTGKKVAVVGSGPSGLTVAGDLVLKGHDVTIFEAFHKPGGVLVYGIPEFRLPKEIVFSEVNFLERLGVKLECNVVVGRTVELDELFEQGYDAI